MPVSSFNCPIFKGSILLSTKVFPKAWDTALLDVLVSSTSPVALGKSIKGKLLFNAKPESVMLSPQIDQEAGPTLGLATLLATVTPTSSAAGAPRIIFLSLNASRRFVTSTNTSGSSQ